MITNQPIHIDMVALGEDAANYLGLGYEPFAAFIEGAAKCLAESSEPTKIGWIDDQLEQLSENSSNEAINLLIALGEAAKASKSAK